MKKITIHELIERKYNYNTYFQRDLAWPQKIKSCFIDSIMKNFYVPPILVANNQIIDGKQRITTMENFEKGNFYWHNVDDNTFRKYSDLNWEEKKKFNDFEIFVFDLGDVNTEFIRETFIRINEGSVKLNKAELRLAKANGENRKMVFQIATNDNILKISNNKKNDKRFSVEDLIIRCLTIIYMPLDKKGVRPQMDKILLSNLGNTESICKNFKRTIDCMFNILSNDTIPVKTFNTIFESIFCSMYRHINSKNYFLENKDEIKSKILEKIEEISNDQMGGGIKFDSLDYISKRIAKIDMILENYLIDKKRSFSSDEKLIIWKNNEHVCSLCKKIILDLNDFEPDHIIAHTQGGPTNLSNARILCQTCNRREGVKTREKFKNKKI